MALKGRRIDITTMIQGKLWCALAKFFQRMHFTECFEGWCDGWACWMMCQGDNFEGTTSVGRLIVVMEK